MEMEDFVIPFFILSSRISPSTYCHAALGVAATSGSSGASSAVTMKRGP